MTAELVTLGESMGLLSTPTIGLLRHARSLNLSMAGAESNLAIGVSRLGRRAAWISRVGDDEFGRLVTGSLAAEGVDTGHVTVDPAAPTGLMIKERRADSVTRVMYYRAGSAASRLSAADVDEDLVRGARLLHVTGITPALSASAADAVSAAVETATAAGVPISLDLNYRAALWDRAAAGAALRPLVRRADIVFATVPEARLVASGGIVPGDRLSDGGASALAAGIAGLGPRQVLLKRGARGAVAMLDGEFREAPAHRVTVVDPVGAGDAFAAAYLAEYLGGAPADDCLAAATAAGAFAVTVPGDWEGLPHRAELALLGADPDDDVHR